MAHQPKPATSDLKSHLGFWMRFVSNHVSRSFAEKLSREGVTVAEWVLLRELYALEPKVSHGEITRKTGFTKGAVSKLLSKLADKNLVIVKPSAEDARAQQIELTSQGKSKVPRLAALADKNDDEYFGVLNEQEKRRLLVTLKKLTEANGLKAIPVD